MHKTNAQYILLSERTHTVTWVWVRLERLSSAVITNKDNRDFRGERNWRKGNLFEGLTPRRLGLNASMQVKQGTGLREGAGQDDACWENSPYAMVVGSFFNPKHTDYLKKTKIVLSLSHSQAEKKFLQYGHAWISLTQDLKWKEIPAGGKTASNC